jgi:hypothetical protein
MGLPLTSGVGPPMTFMLDGRQYIAVMAGTGAGQRGRGAGPGPGGPPLEPTAAAAEAANSAGQARQPAAPAPPNTNPKLFVYSVPN